MERRTLIALFLAGLLVPGGIAAAGGLLSDAEPASGDVAIGATDGPTVVVTGISNKIELTEFTPDPNTVNVTSDAGNATFTSQGHTHAQADQIEGAWTNLSALNVTNAALTVDPVDKQQATVSGDTDTFAYRDSMQLDDDTVDFVYSGASGTTTVTVRGLPANADIAAVDQTNTLLAAGTSNSNGVVTLSGMPNSEHNVTLVEGSPPKATNLDPGGDLNTAPSELSVDITDVDFPEGDSVTVEFTLDGSVISTQTVSSNGTVTASISSSGKEGGQHNWSVNATDDYGLSDVESASYGIPNELRFVNESNPSELLNQTTITATFFDGNITTRSTSDGTIDMSGLDATDEFTVDVVVDGEWHDRTVYIESIVNQRTVYVLRDNQSVVTSVTNRFTLRDRTGNFEGNGARLAIQKAINVSGSTEWQTIHGDEFGTGGVQAELEKNVRYRLVVSNADGNTRVLGTYVAEANETVPLTIGTVTGDPVAGTDGYRYNATYDNSTGTPRVRFTYNDTNTSTSEISVTIFEKGNESNVLFRNQTFFGPYGTLSVSEMVPANQTQKTWIVKAVIERNGEQQTIREQVGPRNAVLLQIPNWLKVFISIGSLWIVAGLFSRLNGHIGGLVVAGMGGMFWYVDFLPQETGIGVVVLALITAGILFIKERATV